MSRYQSSDSHVRISSLGGPLPAVVKPSSGCAWSRSSWNKPESASVFANPEADAPKQFLPLVHRVVLNASATREPARILKQVIPSQN